MRAAVKARAKAPEHDARRSTPLARRPAWKALAAHARKIRPRHLRALFAADPKRGERLTLEAAGLFLDYSKNRVTDQTMTLLVKLAKESVSSKALFNDNPKPTKMEIKEALDGNLCRCTGYNSIIRALMDVAKGEYKEDKVG